MTESNRCDEHPLWELIVGQIRVEHGQILCVRKSRWYCGYGIVDHRWVMLSDIVVGLSLWVRETLALKTSVRLQGQRKPIDRKEKGYHIFLIIDQRRSADNIHRWIEKMRRKRYLVFRPGDALVLEEIDDRADIGGNHVKIIITISEQLAPAPSSISAIILHSKVISTNASHVVWLRGTRHRAHVSLFSPSSRDICSNKQSQCRTSLVPGQADCSKYMIFGSTQPKE